MIGVKWNQKSFLHNRNKCNLIKKINEWFLIVGYLKRIISEFLCVVFGHKVANIISQLCYIRWFRFISLANRKPFNRLLLNAQLQSKKIATIQLDEEVNGVRWTIWFWCINCKKVSWGHRVTDLMNTRLIYHHISTPNKIRLDYLVV